MRPDMKVVRLGHGRSRVYLNGEELPGVKRVELHFGVNEADQVVVTFIPDHLRVEDRQGVEIENSQSIEEALGVPSLG